MRILSLGLDNSVLKRNAPVAKRVVEYGSMVDKYTIIVPSSENGQVDLSNQVQVYGVGAGRKFIILFKIYNLAQRLIKKYKYDVITVQDQYYLALLGWLLGKKHKIGLEIQIHGWEKFYGLRKLITKFVIPRVRAVRTVSLRTKRRLIKELGVSEDKITVVPIYVKTDVAESTGLLRRRFTPFRNDSRVIFLTVGRLVPIKNIKLQIRALAEVVKRYTNIELWIIGDGLERGNLKLEIGNLGLDEKVKIFGWQDNLDKFYSQADVFLLTSDYEGWGMAVIEAAVMGLPIIMTDVGCAGEVIKDEESGIVIPGGSKDKLAKAMITLIKSKELREKLGEGARQAILNLPNKKETLKLYQESWNKAIL